jgi:subtilisin family serine protease
MTVRPRALVLAAAAVLLAGPAAHAKEPAPPPPASPPSSPSPDAVLDAAYLPKAELRVPEFLAQRPQADGRGVLVAICDTGVDPGHPRLAKTSTGEVKIVDFLDATDDGWIDTSTPAEPAADGSVVGTSGRTLILGAHVKPGKRHGLGRILASDVLPRDLVDRLKSTRKDAHGTAARRAKEAGTPVSPARPGEDAAAADARRGAEAEVRDRDPDDLPAWDVLVCERDDGWRVVIDTDADGDLANEREISDYSKDRQWVTLRDDAEMNVSVRPDADGKRVRLLFDGGGHGTHVAGIVAGYEAPGSAWNGLAPGAQVLAIKIGNSQWGGPTTNLSVVRALDLAGKRGAKVVNMSFGGPSFVADAGTPDARAADEAVERYGLLCTFSAGNEGPSLSTVGSPATARRALSVGAYVSPALMKVAYAQLGPEPGERLFPFSSRGPLPGGDLGISVLAPGAAWSALPSWMLVHGENWNGTSMAAPQVAGAAALLLSAAAKDGVPAPPARLIRAIEASARPVERLLPCEQGAGLVQVDRAYDALVSMKAAPEEREIRARVNGSSGVGGGVYERSVVGDAPFDRDVDLNVVWPKDGGEDANAARAGYEKRLTLAADASWIQVPPRVVLNSSGGRFTVRVDPKGLTPGIHAGRVRAFDPSRPDDGPEVVVPVTVIRPEDAGGDGAWHGRVAVEPGDRSSTFLRVPLGASRLRVRLVQDEPAKNRVTLSVGTLDAWRRQDDRIREERFDLECCTARETTVTVLPGTVEEIVLFSHWPTNVPAHVAIEARFEGPTSPDASLSAGPGEDVLLLRLASPLAPFSGRVSGRIDRTVERPEVTKETVVDPRGESVFGGDLLYVCRQRFTVRVKAGESTRVVPLSTRALDEQREDARWRILDEAGRVVRRAVIEWTFDFDGLPAGTYAVEYETPTWGRAAADAGITGFEVERSRSDAGLTVYPTADLAVDGRGEDSSVDLRAGAVRSVALRLPALEAGTISTGVVEVKDRDDRVRLSLPVRVDRRTSDAPSASDLRARLVRALREDAERTADDASASADARKKALDDVRQALSFEPKDRALRIVEARLALDFAADGPSRAEAGKRIDGILAELDRKNGNDRADVGRLYLARARLRRMEGKKAEADADFSESRFLLPEGDPGVLIERLTRGLAPEGDLRDALAAAKAVSEADPASFAASARVVDVLLRLQWGVPAAAEVRRWPERYPTRTAELRAIVPKVKAAGGDPAPRTLAQINAATP